MRPEFKGNLTQAAIHQLYEKQEARGKKKKQQKERGGSYNQKSTKGEACFNCGAKPVHPRSQWPATQSVFKKCGKEGHYGSRSVCKSKEEGMKRVRNPAYRCALKRRQHSGRLYASVFYCSRALFEDGNGKDS